MKASQFHIATLKEAPTDAEIVSHRLMTRAGMIRKLAGGIYNYMPMGLRSIRKIEAIIRDEMNAAGAIELLMPVVQPAELWMESGRWEKYGPELLRVQDRHGRDFIVQPTSEEVITDIARQELRSYRQLPRNFYHIQTKFRDERRPRFGVMRGREFTMKDAYSFDRSREAALASYRAMFEAYTRIFTRMGLTFRAVSADTGAIGGSASHEFQVIAETGEDAIAFCRESEFAANIELAEALPLLAERAAPADSLQKIATPDCTKCESVAQLLELPLEQTVKSLVLAIDRREPVKDGSVDGGSPARITDTRICLLLVRGDHELNEVKAGKVPGLEGFRFATESEIIEHFGCVPGYIGPIGIPRHVRVIADRTVARMSDFVCGANDPGFHYSGANWDRDCSEPEVADLRNVRAGDPSPDCQGVLEIQRGIEVGHVFYLGTKYSDAMNARFVDEDGQSKPFEMGCYGIGVTRLLGAAIEQNHDERGIIWPAAIAPFEVVITPLGMDRSEAVRSQAESLHRQVLAAGFDAILDDRGERPGAMFADWELIGVPVRITVGERDLKEGVIEVQPRRAREAIKLAPGEVVAKVLELLRSEGSQARAAKSVKGKS